MEISYIIERPLVEARGYKPPDPEKGRTQEWEKELYAFYQLQKDNWDFLSKFTAHVHINGVAGVLSLRHSQKIDDDVVLGIPEHSNI